MPSPTQEIKNSLFQEKGIRLFVKREDLIHPVVSGNKWRKLKYNLQKAKEEGKDTILSFGGAYSNHIHALAAAAKAFGIKSIGIIRGEENFPLNDTLSYASYCGMQLFYVSREEYKGKTEISFINTLHKRFGSFYLIPEGGYNYEGMKGCKEIVSEIDVKYDVVCCACGTGTTFAGIISALPKEKKAIGFPVLKGGDFLYDEIHNLLPNDKQDNWHLETGYHFGGYAKWNNELLDFIKDFEKENGILLEQVYTGKLFFGIYDLIQKDFFKPGTSIVAVHTGGLQGKVNREQKQ